VKYLVVSGNEYGLSFNLSDPLNDNVTFINSLDVAEEKFKEKVDEGEFAVIMYELVIPEPGSAYMKPLKHYLAEEY
jgi:hypothetical protein